MLLGRVCSTVAWSASVLVCLIATCVDLDTCLYYSILCRLCWLWTNVCTTAACAVSVLVCPTPDCAASVLVCSIAACAASVLVSPTAACAASVLVSPTAACAASVLVSPTAACAASVLVYPKAACACAASGRMSVLQQPVMPLEAWLFYSSPWCPRTGLVYRYSSLWCSWKCMVNSSLCCSWTSLICRSLQGQWQFLSYSSLSVVSGRVCSIAAFVMALEVSGLAQPVCCIWKSLCVCTYNSSLDCLGRCLAMQLLLHLDVSVRQQPMLCRGIRLTVACAEPILYVSVNKSLRCTVLGCLLGCTRKCLSTRTYLPFFQLFRQRFETPRQPDIFN